jgi:hypothetical protein
LHRQKDRQTDTLKTTDRRAHRRQTDTQTYRQKTDTRTRTQTDRLTETRLEKETGTQAE